MMSEYLCRVHIDLTKVPKNNRADFVLENVKRFNNNILVFDQKHALIKIFPRDTKQLNETLSKVTTCPLPFSKYWYALQKKAIFVFNENEMGTLEENIFISFENSNKKVFVPCVKLEHDQMRGTYFVPYYEEGIKNARKNNHSCSKYELSKINSGIIQLEPQLEKVDMIIDDHYTAYEEGLKNPRKKNNCFGRFKLRKSNSGIKPLEPQKHMITNNSRKMLTEPPLVEKTCMTSNPEYVNDILPLQYCVAHMVQPSVGLQSRSDVHSDGGGSIQSSVGQSISNPPENSFGNPQSEYSLPEMDGATLQNYRAVTVSSNGESDLEYGQHPQHPGFADCYKRKASFATWRQFVSFKIDALVNAGFYFTGEGTVVRCYFCGTELANLTPDDDPLAEHERKLPSCGYLRSSLGPDYQARTRSGAFESQPANASVVDPFRVTSRNPGSWSASDRIRSPQYQAYSIRLSTFDRWSRDISQTPAQVADAGFYYTGLQDVVRCFACDGGLKNWDPEDDPWIEHARWFQECPFVKRVKGQEFIDLVRRMTEEEDEEEDAVVHSTFHPNNPIMNNEIISQVNQENAEDVLDTDAAKYVLNEGYSREIVATAINELLTKGKSDYTSKDIQEIISASKDKDGGGQGKMNPSTMPGRNTEKNDSKRRLMEENQRLHQIIQCVTCKAAKRDILLLPCTHLCLCSNCSDKSSICPVCYKRISEKIKTYVI